jgi:dipeptidyl-peptidase-4
MIRRFFILSCLLLPACFGLSVARSATNHTHETRDVLGWKVHVSKSLRADEPEATATAMDLLEKQLAEIIRVVPAKAVDELKKVPLWFSPEYPGIAPKAEFHPDGGWLKDNGRDPAMAEAIEFTNIRIFPEECRRMPNFALHELAHAYHFRVLGFDDRAIIDAYERAKAAGIYERVERHRGGGKPNAMVRAYAMTDHKEYFAETTEAFFSRNDFFPFTREELRVHDPRMFGVLEAAWGVKTP